MTQSKKSGDTGVTEDSVNAQEEQPAIKEYTSPAAPTPDGADIPTLDAVEKRR